jgi:hypothetical protein
MTSQHSAALLAALLVLAGVVSHVAAAEDIKIQSIDRKVGNRHEHATAACDWAVLTFGFGRAYVDRPKLATGAGHRNHQGQEQWWQQRRSCFALPREAAHWDSCSAKGACTDAWPCEFPLQVLNSSILQDCR